MATRHRSQDASKATGKLSDDKTSVSQQGRSGGNLQRDVSTQDEEKRATEQSAGITRVTGEDKRNHGESA